VTFVNFNQDVKVQVFEVTIRVLGALLSTFQTLEKLPEGEGPQVHKDKIMSLAKDLGSRLLPAFDTSTGIPYARVNLKHGVEKGESVETCKFPYMGT
jgi:mannosidase alpha-like ER degradation enhancer 1